MLIGIDEAGRGPVLGPLVVGICAVPEGQESTLEVNGCEDLQGPLFPKAS